MTEITVLQLMDYLEQQNGDDASWMWLELRRLLEEQEKANQSAAQPSVQRTADNVGKSCPIHGHDYNGMCGLCVAAANASR